MYHKEIHEYGELYYHVVLEQHESELFFDEASNSKFRVVLKQKIRDWLRTNVGEQVRWLPWDHTVTSNGMLSINGGTYTSFSVFASSTGPKYLSRSVGNWGIEQNNRENRYAYWQSFYFRNKEDADRFYTNWATYVRMMS